MKQIVFPNFNPIIHKETGREYPYPYLILAINLYIDAIYQKNPESRIVEAGSMRIKMNHSIDEVHGCCLEGHSTAIFGMYAKKMGIDFISVDISASNIKLSESYINAQDDAKVRFVNQDVLEFMQIFTGAIDFLYLDAWDVGTPRYAQNHLDLYKLSRKNLCKKAILLIDDTDIDRGGIGKMIISKAVDDGFIIILEGRQTLLIRH